MRKIYAYKKDKDCPVQCFFEKADVKITNKFQTILTHISNEKNGLCEPYVRHISQNKYRDMYEIRLKVSGVMARIIFSKQEENIILLYAFYKNDKKDTKRALEHSLRLLNDTRKNNYMEVLAV